MFTRVCHSPGERLIKKRNKNLVYPFIMSRLIDKYSRGDNVYRHESISHTIGALNPAVVLVVLVIFWAFKKRMEMDTMNQGLRKFFRDGH